MVDGSSWMDSIISSVFSNVQLGPGLGSKHCTPCKIVADYALAGCRWSTSPTTSMT
jgi:hypothetical protein